jgi:hypothetical protein
MQLSRVDCIRLYDLLTGPTDEDGNIATRSRGLLVARGTLLVVISPVDGSEEIANPFTQNDEEDEEAIFPT